MIGGAVTNVRELKGGVQAKVSVGASGSHGYASIEILSTSPGVRSALELLKDELRKDANSTLRAAQDDERNRGRTPLGERDE